MNTAEVLRAEGRAEGRAERQQEVLTQGRGEGRAGLLTEQLIFKFGELDANTRHRIEHATAEQISEWSARLISGADSLDDVLLPES